MVKKFKRREAGFHKNLKPKLGRPFKTMSPDFHVLVAYRLPRWFVGYVENLRRELKEMHPNTSKKITKSWILRELIRHGMTSFEDEHFPPTIEK